MENEKSKKDKQDKKTTEGEAREKEEEIKTTERLALDLELTLGRNLSRRPSPWLCRLRNLSVPHAAPELQLRGRRIWEW
jgi:hypothetical protein